METKRTTQEGHYAQATNSFSQLLDDDLRARLASVGPRARKQVSEGHLTATNIPSLEGMTTGTLNQDQLRRDYMREMSARPAHSMGDIGTKRMRDVEDDYGDTEDDEDEAPTTDTQKKVYYRPNSHRSMSSQTEDFGDADFLKPR